MVILYIVYISCFVLTETVHGVNVDWPTYEVNGKICYFCPAGFYWIDHCQLTGTQAQCTPCPTNTYQKDKNIAHYCGTCTKCDSVVRNHDLAAVLVPCSGHSDTVCGCKQTYHFRPDHGGIGEGTCHKNSMCPVGTGVLEKASNFTDTKCVECESGFTYSSSESYEPCLKCTATCPNSTNIKYPCNMTHNIECQTSTDHMESTKNKTPGKSGQTHYLAIGLGTGAAILVVVVVMVILIYKKRRARNANNGLVPEGQTSLQAVIQRRRSSKTLPKIPQWTKECFKENSVKWEQLFGICPEHIVPDWESFVRRLFVLSDEAEKGDKVVNLAKAAVEQERIKSRIYFALDKWRQKCVTCDKEIQMFYIFCDAVHEHEGQSCLISFG